MKQANGGELKEKLFRVIHSKSFLAISAVLLVSAWGLIIYGVYFSKENPNKVIATVSDKKIIQKDLNQKLYEIDTKGTPENPGKFDEQVKKEALRVLVEDYIIDLESGKLGISITDEEIQKEAKNIPDYDSLSSQQKTIVSKNAKLQILRTKVEGKVVSFREGKVIVARFDQEGKDNKKYAESLINGINSDLKSGKISFEAAMEKTNNDTTIGKKSFSPNVTLLSHSFNKSFSENRNGLFKDEGFVDKAFSLKKNQVSEPFIVKYNNKETLYAMLKVTGNYDFSSRYLSMEEWFTKKKAEYNVSYPTNIKPVAKNDLKSTNKNTGLASLIPKALAAENGSCGGGLTPAGGAYPTALEVQFFSRPALGGAPIAFSGASARVNFNPDSIKMNLFGSRCRDRGVYITPNNGTPNANSLGMTNQANGTAGANGWVTFGYNDCGANTRRGFSCHCSDVPGDADYYVVQFFNNGLQEPGYWQSVEMYGSSYSVNGNGVFKFDARPNGDTNTMKVYWQRIPNLPGRITPNNAPNVSLISPNGANFTRNLDGTITVALQARIRDIDNDRVRLYIKIRKPYDPNTEVPEYLGPYDSGLVAVDGAGNYNFTITLNQSDLNENGSYKWSAKGMDERGLWDTSPNYTFGKMVDGNPSVNWQQAWGFTVSDSVVVPPSSGGSCSIALTPKKGIAPLKTDIRVTYSALPPDAVDHQDCVAWDQYGNCTNYTSRYYYWQHENYRLTYQEYDQSNNPIGAEIIIAQGNSVPPTIYNHTFNYLPKTRHFVIKFWHIVRKHNYDGHGVQTTPTEFEYPCGGSGITDIFPRRDSDMNWWEGTPN